MTTINLNVHNVASIQIEETRTLEMGVKDRKFSTRTIRLCDENGNVLLAVDTYGDAARGLPLVVSK